MSRLIDIRTLLSDRNAHLLNDDIDLAVRIGRLHDSSTITTQVGVVHQITCGSPNYFAANGVPKSPGDLLKLSVITFEALNSGTSWAFGGKKGEVLPIRSRLSGNTAEAAIDAAIAGVGVTRVLSYQAAQAIADGKLQVVLSSFEPAPVPVSIIYANQNMLPLKTRSFIDFAAPRLRARLSQLADPPRSKTRNRTDEGLLRADTASLTDEGRRPGDRLGLAKCLAGSELPVLAQSGRTSRVRITRIAQRYGTAKRPSERFSHLVDTAAESSGDLSSRSADPSKPSMRG